MKRSAVSKPSNKQAEAEVREIRAAAPRSVCPKCLKALPRRRGPLTLVEDHLIRGRSVRCPAGAAGPDGRRPQALQLTREDLHDRIYPPLAAQGTRFVVPTTTVEVISASKSRITVRDLDPIGKATWSFTKSRWLKMKPVQVVRS